MLAVRGSLKSSFLAGSRRGLSTPSQSPLMNVVRAVIKDQPSLVCTGQQRYTTDFISSVAEGRRRVHRAGINVPDSTRTQVSGYHSRPACLAMTSLRNTMSATGPSLGSGAGAWSAIMPMRKRAMKSFAASLDTKESASASEDSMIFSYNSRNFIPSR